MKLVWHVSDLSLTPQRKTPEAMAFDLVTPYAFTIEGIGTNSALAVGKHLVQTQVSVDIPLGYALVIGSRSGLAAKDYITVEAGWIDSDYTGELGVVLYNHGPNAKSFKAGDRIAQCRLVPVIEVLVETTTEPINKVTERGEGGFGSTGN